MLAANPVTIALGALAFEKVTPDDGDTVQVPTSLNKGEFPYRYNGVVLQIDWSVPALAVVGPADAILT